jgi:glyoxylase-like metal-dependent hydrolase (beta-lactamase superfamily II)
MRVPIFSVFFAAVATAQFPPPTLSDKTVQVSNHVHVIMGFPNVVIVTGDEATLVIDTGLGPSNGATVARVARKLSKGQKLYLTTTHFHPEHVAGEAGFPAEIILIRPAVQQQEMIAQGADILARFRAMPEYSTLLKDVETFRTPDLIFDNEVKLDLGGTTARLMWLGAAHTKGDELILVDPDSTLISGDVVQNKVFPREAAEGYSFASWVAVLDKLEALRPRQVVPDHSRPGDGSLIAQERAFILDMRSRAIAFEKQGIPAADAGKRLTEDFKAAYPEWASNTDWPNLNYVSGFVQRIYAEDNK